MLSKILAILKYGMIRTGRDKTGLAFMILLPVFFTFITSMMFSSVPSSDSEEERIEVGLVIEETGEVINNLIKQVEDNSAIKFDKISKDELFESVKSQSLGVGIIIPKGFSKQIESKQTPEMEIVKLPSSTEYMAVMSVINNTFNRMTMKEKNIEAYKALMVEKGKQPTTQSINSMSEEISNRFEQPLITVNEEIYNANTPIDAIEEGKIQYSIGFLVMFVMFTVVFNAGDILEEKKYFTWQRLKTTPTTSFTLITGKIMDVFITGWLQSAFLILFGKYVLGVNWSNSTFLTLLIISVYILAATAIGIFLSSIVKTSSQLGVIGSLAITISSMIAGCWWPIEFSPEFMQKLALVTPQYWAIKGLKSVIILNQSISAIYIPLLALVGITIVFIVLSMPRNQFD